MIYKFREILYKIRVSLITLLAGKDISIITNVTLIGTIYIRGKWILISHRFRMGNPKIKTDPQELEEEVDDETNVDSNA